MPRPAARRSHGIEGRMLRGPGAIISRHASACGADRGKRRA
jgi:hypothetical protein